MSERELCFQLCVLFFTLICTFGSLTVWWMQWMNTAGPQVVDIWIPGVLIICALVNMGLYLNLRTHTKNNILGHIFDGVTV